MQKVQIFIYIGLLLPILLGDECSKTALPNLIQGLNFHGQIQLNNDTLKIDITNFNDGAMYNIQINNCILEREYRRYIVFQNVEELFDELMINWNMEISPDYDLIVPIEVSFKNQIKKLKIEIPLIERKFKNQGQKVHTLLEQMKRMNQQKLRKSRPQQLTFKRDETNTQYRQFQFNKDQRTLKYLANNQHTIFNHQATLPQTGIFTFKIKIIKSVNKHLFTGICGKDIKAIINPYHNSLFIGLHLSNNYLYGRGTQKPVATPKPIIEGSSVIKTVIDMTRRQISWYLDDQLLYGSAFWKEMKDIEIYPIVTLHNNGDIIQFL